MASQDPTFNFFLGGLQTSTLKGTVSGGSEVAGGALTNILDLINSHTTWITETAGPAAMEFFLRYGTPVETRALHLGGGRIPLFGTLVRVVRGYNLEPMLVLWDTEAAATNATGTLDRTVDPRTAVAGSFITASTPGSDWSATLDFAMPEVTFAFDRTQKLVIVASATGGSGDPTMLVEVKDDVSVFQPMGVVDLGSLPDGTTGRYSIRLEASQMSTPPEVRISGTFVSTGDLRLHGMAIVGPVRDTFSAQRLTGAFLTTVGTVTGSAAQTRHNPADTNVAEEEGIVLADAGNPNTVRVALDTDPRVLASARLLWTWKPGTVGDEITAKLFQDGVEISQIGPTHTTVSTAVQKEDESVTLGAVTTAENLEIEFSRTAGAGPTTISTVAFHPTFVAPAAGVTETHDTGWQAIQENAASDMSGGLAIDGIASLRPKDVSIAVAYRSGLISLAVTAPETFVDLDMPQDPVDADQVLLLDDQTKRDVSFRHMIECPGLAAFRLQPGIKTTMVDTSIIRETMGKYNATQLRRVFREVSCVIGILPPEISQQVELLLRMVGQSDPILLIALPDTPQFSQQFSIFATLKRPPTLAHTHTPTLIGATIELKEF